MDASFRKAKTHKSFFDAGGWMPPIGWMDPIGWMPPRMDASYRKNDKSFVCWSR